MSQIEVKVNWILIFILAVQIVCCILMAILYGTFQAQIQ